MTREQELEEMEKQSKLNEYNELLQQKDYMGRKVAFEVAEKLQELYPNLSMPVYTKYRALEDQAQIYREEINKLQ